jgi:hypothetical protein
MSSVRRDDVDDVHTAVSFQTREGRSAALAIFTRAVSYL